MRVWISDFLALLYTRLLSFCLVLFAAWSAFFAGAAAAAARTNTGRLANGTTTREVHDTPSNKKKTTSTVKIHTTLDKLATTHHLPTPNQNSKPWTNSNFARSAATRLVAGFVPANSKQSSYPILSPAPSTVTIHNPSIHSPLNHLLSPEPWTDSNSMWRAGADLQVGFRRRRSAAAPRRRSAAVCRRRRKGRPPTLATTATR